VSNFFNFGDVQIFRPSHAAERAFRESAREHLLTRFSPGEYRGVEAANAVIQHHFTFYEKLLRPLISKLASPDAAEFLLFQYDEAARIFHSHGILDLRERETWMEIEPIFTRAIKYLVEAMCLEASTTRPSIGREEAIMAMESALICAESMVGLSQASELVHSVFPDDCVARVFDTERPHLSIGVEGPHSGCDKAFSERVIRDRESRKQFVGFPQFDNHTATHQRYLDDAFRQSFGINYGEFIAAIIAVVDGCQPSLHPNALPGLFVHRGRVIEELAKSGRPQTAIERAIDGFSVSPENLAAEGRVIWKPKQENRAYRRGFYIFPHETGPHLAFSRAMARQNLFHLVSWVCFKHLPVEWETPATRDAAEGLSRAAGDWFEEVVCRNLNAVGVLGQRAHRTVGSGQQRMRVPEPVGEIDFLGYQPQEKLLVLIEAKMVMTGLEPRYWRDDLDRFVFRSGSYAERFRRKLSWVAENRCAISAALGFDAVAQVGAAMLTLYPCIARAFISDFPCVSLTEFMLDYEQKSRWPYPLA
jgi:hypothetical protein